MGRAGAHPSDVELASSRDVAKFFLREIAGLSREDNIFNDLRD